MEVKQYKKNGKMPSFSRTVHLQLLGILYTLKISTRDQPRQELQKFQKNFKISATMWKHLKPKIDW